LLDYCWLAVKYGMSTGLLGPVALELGL